MKKSMSQKDLEKAKMIIKSDNSDGKVLSWLLAIIIIAPIAINLIK